MTSHRRAAITLVLDQKELEYAISQYVATEYNVDVISPIIIQNDHDDEGPYASVCVKHKQERDDPMEYDGPPEKWIEEIISLRGSSSCRRL